MDKFSDWQWQLANRITTGAALSSYVSLTDQLAQDIEQAGKVFRWSITPYYASLMDRDNPLCPIRMQAIPCKDEVEEVKGISDPLQEEHQSPTPGLIHRYPDRVALTVSSTCAMYCRHCTRKRFVGEVVQKTSWSAIQAGIDYVSSHSEVRDVLVTGGDPLILPDGRLEQILKQLRSIEHVDIIRIGSRVPVTLPQRITPQLCEMLERYHPIWLNTHFNHPKEITDESATAISRLLKAGIPVGNQTVLLKGINDNLGTMRQLVHGLLRIRVRPYYLYQCDRVVGTQHFWTPLQTGLDIIDGLQGYTSGLAVPQFIVDSPIGKIPISNSKLVELGESHALLRNYEGSTMRLDFSQPIPTSCPMRSVG